MSIYTAAYTQDNFAVVGTVIKQFDEQIGLSAEKSFLLFCQSLQGCQTHRRRTVVALINHFDHRKLRAPHQLVKHSGLAGGTKSDIEKCRIFDHNSIAIQRDVAESL